MIFKKNPLKSRNLSEKKTHPEHKYSVTFVSNVGTINDKLLFVKYGYTKQRYKVLFNLKAAARNANRRK